MSEEKKSDNVIFDHGINEEQEWLEWEARRKKRLEAARKEKEKQEKTRRILKYAVPAVGGLLAALLLAAGINSLLPSNGQNKENVKQAEGNLPKGEALAQQDSNQTTETLPEGQADLQPGDMLQAVDADVNAGAGGIAKPDARSSTERYEDMLTDKTRYPGEEVISSYAILLDADTGKILANREGMTRMNPASMTKILTILVAAEHVENLDDQVTITREITDYCYVNDCSAVGFAENETVPVKDLFYGTILPSGADAAAALAIYTAGSLEAFVELMNEKLEELGLSETAHMTNCVGLYDKEHYCTVYDMALILQAATEYEICRQALNAHSYTTAATTEHPEGITISNWFLRRIEDKDTRGEVLYAKTGFVDQAGSCAASYQLGDDGKNYICVTANAFSSWRAIYDQVELYANYT